MQIQKQWLLRHQYFLFIAFLTCFFSITHRGMSQQNTNKWELVSQEGATKVYTRNSNKSDFKEVRIMTRMEVELGAFIEVLNDVPSYDKWVYKCENPYAIKTISSNESYYYVQSNLPFPLSDRDLVVHSKQWYGEDGMSYHTHSTAAPELIQKKKGLVRMNYYESFWNIHENKDGSLSIEYKVFADPAGYLPAWMVNLVVSQGPLETMKRLETFVIERSILAAKYKEK